MARRRELHRCFTKMKIIYRDETMNTQCKRYMNSYLSILVVCTAVYTQPVSASEWWKSFEQQSGFSEFAPPSLYSENKHQRDDKQWRSGSSFNKQNKQRYAPVMTKKNPWKPVSSMHYKKSFSSQRPWGNVPDRKPTHANNMKFHDQRFKRWSHQQDAYYHDNFRFTNPSMNYAQPSLPFVTNYGFPGSMYNAPLITPGSYSRDNFSRGILTRRMFNAPGYGIQPVAFNPYTASVNRPWNW